MHDEMDTVSNPEQAMGPSKSQYRLIAEISHQINSPLAAIRNALYLAITRTKDAEVLRYLRLADEEVTAIANRIREIRCHIEEGQSSALAADARSMVQSMRKAA